VSTVTERFYADHGRRTSNLGRTDGTPASRTLRFTFHIEFLRPVLIGLLQPMVDHLIPLPDQNDFAM
jgi:hypothetical protein